MKPHFPQFVVSLAFAVSLSAQISAPSPGLIRNGALPIQTIYGIAGSLVPAPSTWGAADALAFADRFGLLASGGQVKLVRSNGLVLGQIDAPDSHPLLSIDSEPVNAIVWLPEARSLLYWNNNQWQQVAVNGLPDEVLVTSITRDSGTTARMLLTQPDNSVIAARLSMNQVSVTQGSVTSIDVLPGVRGPAFQFGPQVIWRDEQGLVIASAAGQLQQTLALAATGAFTAERMSSEWVHLHFPADGGTDWALHLCAKPTLSRLPGGKR